MCPKRKKIMSGVVALSMWKLSRPCGADTLVRQCLNHHSPRRDGLVSGRHVWGRAPRKLALSGVEWSKRSEAPQHLDPHRAVEGHRFSRAAPVPQRLRASAPVGAYA